MPEGPEIRRAADKLEAAVGGEPLTEVWFAFEELKPYEALLVGETIRRIATRGKAMLTHFSNGLTLYSHNQLYGQWLITQAGETVKTHRVLRVRFQTAEKAILLYSASNIEMLERAQLAQHPFLHRLGPDVLDETLTIAQVKARLLSPRFRYRQFSGLLLDQAFLAGVGNYLRAEILWEAQLAPHHRAGDLTVEQAERFAGALLAIPRLSYQTRGQADKSKHHGAIFHFRVFHRAGEPCERCGGIIEKTTLSSRPFYGCPRCQK